ncbi:MAG: hypothetical protein ACJAT7_003670 [Psychromonas sp.]|jgi:hypothetical protein|uniref:hypothetical protein n=1 Tax=Psychromonas sp. TaxID=1884585 RepID=UPI0039E31FBC
MKKYIYPSLVAFLSGVSVLLSVYIVYQSNDVAHYKKLYFETDKILEAHLGDMHYDSDGEVVIVVHSEQSSK